MQVLTLDDKAFDRHASMLADKVSAHSGYFDIIIGVRRGGSFVCDAFCHHFPRERYGVRSDVTLQRPSTKHKGRFFSKIMKRLPIWLLDLMRMAEARILAFRHDSASPPPLRDIEADSDLKTRIATAERPDILIIDDAIDSGDTLYSIIHALKNMNPDARITIAVMTQTTANPRVRADYTLYDNRTLIRFPWSNDYRTHRKEPHS